jgi:long-subunit acyl-CoA synthetase (AMP-forming)
VQIELLLGETPRVAPGRIALTDGRRTLTYAQLGAVVQAEAHFLRANGGLRFGLLAENGCGWAIADLALQHLQRLNVPLPAYFTAAQMRHAVDDAGIDTLVTDRPEKVLDLWPEFRLAGLSPSSGLTVLCREVDEDCRPVVPFGVTKITYTSGSTADPKGVCLTSATMNCVTRAMVQVTEAIGIRRHLCLMPLPTLLENLAGMSSPLRAGASCILPSGADTGMSYGSLDPQRLLKTLTLYQPDSLVLVPELLRLLVRAAQGGFPIPRSLKFIAVGGAPVARSLLEEAAELRLPVYEGYGLSECASVVCLNTPHSTRRGSVGLPMPHVRVRVDEGGQLRVRGAVMSCYLGDSASYGPVEIATGDLAEVDEDGYVYIRGRLKNLFITSFGRNVSPEWVERELAHEPAIRHVLACGEGRSEVRALVCAATPEVDQASLASAIERANGRLPDYARVRRFARMPEAPTLSNGLLTANGRLRRDRVLERFGALLDEVA